MPYVSIIVLLGVVVILGGLFVMVRTTSFGIMRRLRWLFGSRTSQVIFGGFVLVIAIICLVTYASVMSINHFRENSRLVTHSNEVIQTINDVRLAAAAASSSQRAILVSGSPTFVTSYQTAQKNYVSAITRLEQLANDNPVQAGKARQLQVLLDSRFAGWSSSISQRQAEGFNLDTASAQIADNAQTAGEVSGLFNAITASERSLLSKRNTAYDKSSRQTLVFLALAASLSALLALAILTIITMERRRVEREQRFSRKLQADQAELLNQLKQQTKNIASQRVRDRALLKSIGEGLIATDEYGYITSANPAALEMLGYKQRELIGKWYIKTIGAYDEAGNATEPLERPMAQAIASGNPISTTVYFQRKDGSLFPAFVTVSPVMLRGKPVGAIEVFRDITRERELDKAKDEFVSLASHQLRTPAAGVKAFASMLLDGYGGQVTEQQREFLQQIFDSNERQLRIIEDLLSVARLDAGRITLTKGEVNMSELVNSLIAESRPVIEGRHQKLRLRISKKMPLIVADGDKLRMSVDNLISNASKYTPEGGSITISLKATTTRVELMVQDTGVGIARDDLNRLFNKFTRIENERSSSVGGTGLGLYLANQIVRLHGGSIVVSSQPGKGSRFTLKLPLSRQLMYSRKKEPSKQ